MAVNASGRGDFDLFFANWARTSFGIGIGISHHIVLQKMDREFSDARHALLARQ